MLESPGAMMGMPTTPENMANDGHARDPNMPYSASTPSPTSPQAPMAPRSKRRSEVYASHESPFFYPTQQHYRLMSMDQSTIYSCKIAAKIDRGFFLASNDWTCYRRNYFQISASFSIVGLDTSIYSEVPCLLESKDEVVQVQKFLICIGAQIQNGEKTIELVQHTPKRDKGPQITPSPTPVRAGGELGMSSPGSNPNVITFERVQFKTATANNGKRRAAQQYYQVRVDLFAETERGELIMVATSFSAPLVVRGRSPGHYADNDEGIPGSSTQSMDERYSYRNDSISSSSNGGGPIGSTVGSDYSYYPNYSYGSSYQYQSLGSASHMAAQSNDHGYYERHGSESYPTSPLSPVNQHPGAIDTSLPPHPHPYMAPQVQHGFSPASVSPDMYSAPGFITPDGGNRLPHLQGHPQNGHYPYGSSAYAQYPQQQQEQHDQYQAQQGQQDDDHEAQLAALQIHSPVTPSSPVMSPVASRRQSFSSSLSAKKCDRSSVGPTRKSRSISISGITKRAPSKTRTSRTIPTTPTKELVKGLGISNDRIPELEESQA
ncbi:hypothetical protein BGZ50_006264 [Haplosporangium sp. Z 11]|nr:hypothetical protein BGZ50_006264 [Haplosporangium sp. Z 11]